MDTFRRLIVVLHRYTDPRKRHRAVRLGKEAPSGCPSTSTAAGITHAVMHLIYARFFQKAMRDMGLSQRPEPFPRAESGMVTMGGKAMSKSRGNIVEPSRRFERYGSDALRLYMLFYGPPSKTCDWPSEGVTSIGRVTAHGYSALWRLCEDTVTSSLGELMRVPPTSL